MKALLVVALLACAGCPGMTPAQIVDKTIAVGGDVLACAADDYAAVDDAIRNGGANWVGAIIGLFHCIPQVVRDIAAKEAIAARKGGELELADAATLPDLKYTRLSRGAKRRLAAARVIGQLLNASVKP